MLQKVVPGLTLGSPQQKLTHENANLTILTSVFNDIEYSIYQQYLYQHHPQR